MKIFAHQPLSDFLEQRRQAVVREIQGEPQDHLLNVNEADYVNYLIHKHHLEPVTFAFDATRASSAEKLIPAENHPQLFRVQAGQSYSRPVTTLHVPFTGQPELLQCWPSTRIMWTYEVTVAASEIQFDLINWRDDREALQRDKQTIIDNITEQNAHLIGEVTQFNSQLEAFVRQTLTARKSELLTQLNLAGSLGIPAGVPQTFAIPIVPKKLVIKPAVPAGARGFPSPSGRGVRGEGQTGILPSGCGDEVSRAQQSSKTRVRGEGQTGIVSDSSGSGRGEGQTGILPSGCGDEAGPLSLAAAFPSPSGRGVRGEGQTGAAPPDPTLDNETYQNILGIIHTLGVAMERHPSTYAGKHEQHLRDILLATLCTLYPSSTGETFNNKGRTDILVRHQGSNVFVAECKFWSGLKVFHATIDQLLGYLTWRDSKAAVINFVQETSIAPILEVIATGTPRHPCFLQLESKQGESWLQYEFKLPTDPGRHVHLTVLTFHFPAPPRRPPPLLPEPRFQAPTQRYESNPPGREGSVP
jgi:hypothetical protein